MKFTYQESNKERLDKFLSQQFPEITRSQLKKIILSDRVKVNNQPTTVHHWLRSGDVVDYQEIQFFVD